MITAQKLVEPFFSQNTQIKQEKAFNTFMEKMNVAEKSVIERGLISEEDAERELAKKLPTGNRKKNVVTP